MGEVIRFPFEKRDIWSDAYHAEPCLVLVLPVVRIEREWRDDSPPEEPGRRGRRRR